MSKKKLDFHHTFKDGSKIHLVVHLTTPLKMTSSPMDIANEAEYHRWVMDHVTPEISKNLTAKQFEYCFNRGLQELKNG